MFSWLFSWVVFCIEFCIDVASITIEHVIGHKERVRVLRGAREWQRLFEDSRIQLWSDTHKSK